MLSRVDAILKPHGLTIFIHVQHITNNYDGGISPNRKMYHNKASLQSVKEESLSICSFYLIVDCHSLNFFKVKIFLGE